MEPQQKPKLLNFFLYIAAIVIVIIGAVYYFSDKNLTQEERYMADQKEATNSAAQTTAAPAATGAATPAATAPAASAPTTAAAKPKTYSAAPAMSIDPKKKYTAVLSTNKGDITVEFFASDAPNTVNNFVFLAKDGFYDGTIFHRIVKDFMIQGGDPAGNGTGGPGYKFNDEKVTRDYKRGIMAMANAGPNTNGSQFFIMHKDVDLPKNYTIFGQVTKGIEVVDKIAETPTADSGMGEKSKPTEEIKITKVTVSE